MLFPLLKYFWELEYSNLCTVSLLLYLMVLKTVSPGCGVQVSLMLFSFSSSTNNKHAILVVCVALKKPPQISRAETISKNLLSG